MNYYKIGKAYQSPWFHFIFNNWCRMRLGERGKRPNMKFLQRKTNEEDILSTTTSFFINFIWGSRLSWKTNWEKPVRRWRLDGWSSPWGCRRGSSAGSKWASAWWPRRVSGSCRGRPAALGRLPLRTCCPASGRSPFWPPLFLHESDKQRETVIIRQIWSSPLQNKHNSR